MDAEQGHSQALSVFTNCYEPATKQTLTGFYTSREIAAIVNSHIGIDLSLAELYSLLINMGYQYEMEDGEFRWMVKKDE